MEGYEFWRILGVTQAIGLDVGVCTDILALGTQLKIPQKIPVNIFGGVVKERIFMGFFRQQVYKSM